MCIFGASSSDSQNVKTVSSGKVDKWHFTRFLEEKKHENFQNKIFDIFNIVAQNIDCGYTLEPPRRGCFGSKIKKICIPQHTPVLLYKSGV